MSVTLKKERERTLFSWMKTIYGST